MVEGILILSVDEGKKLRIKIKTTTTTTFALVEGPKSKEVMSCLGGALYTMFKNHVRS